MKFYHRIRTVHEVRIVTPTGVCVHDTMETAATGERRLVVDCDLCAPYRHPMDWSSRPGDVAETYDEIQAREDAIEREKRIGPDIAEVVARITAETMAAKAAPATVADDDPELAQIVAAAKAELARRRAEALSTLADGPPASEGTPVPAGV